MSRAWRAAFSEISTEVDFSDRNHLLTLMKVLPKTTSLKYEMDSRLDGFIYLSALGTGGFSQLTKLELRGTCHPDPELYVGSLPSTLSHLALNSVNILPDSVKYLQCTGLKHFSAYNDHRDGEVSNLLPCLTNLEVSPATFLVSWINDSGAV